MGAFERLIMLEITILVLLLVTLLGALCPLAHWPSFWRVWKSTKINRWITDGARARIYANLLVHLINSPARTVSWYLDELLFHKKINDADMKPPVFIVSQPRSGSTFLHRELAKDEDNFFSVTYFEWKYPYIFLWWIVDKLGLRERLNKISYWSSFGANGVFASKMHPHTWGDHEEHGIFLEEHFYRHYFVFRRFPFREVLDDNGHFSKACDRDRINMLDTFERVVQKVAYYRGNGRRWLTKENESVDFYRALLDGHLTAALIFLVRDHEEMLSSYSQLSVQSTRAKTGMGMGNKSWWVRANIQFRREECNRFVEFFEDYEKHGDTVLVNYEDLNGEVVECVCRIYKALGLSMSSMRLIRLAGLASLQEKRDREYIVPHIDEEHLQGFASLQQLIDRSRRSNDADYRSN